MFIDFDSHNARTLHKVFHGLYSDMQHAYAACDSQRLEPTVQSVDSWRKLPMTADMRKQIETSGAASMEYFPPEIQRHVLNEQSTAITYRFLAGRRSVVLHFVVFNTPNPDLKKMLEHATRVCALMHLVSAHASRSTCSATLHIFVYMTEFKKLFPAARGEALDAEHANTGMSYHCAKDNDIVVYREEEWFKVLIHEAFHAFGLSFIESDMPRGVDAAMQRVLQRTYAISHPVLVYETYCEIWARVLNVCFACFSPPSMVGGSPILNVHLNAFIECVLGGLHRDAQFALQQCAKIMHYMDIPWSVMRNPTKDTRAIVAQKYRENTNVFAYYVMTCALQNSPDVFLVWCYKNNPTTAAKPRANLLQFRTIPANFNGFMEMLHHCSLKPIMLTHGNNQDLLDVDVLGSTMRMTTPRPETSSHAREARNE
jgi:hypothetical protein